MIWGHLRSFVEILLRHGEGKVSDHFLMEKLLCSTPIIFVAIEKNLEPMPVMGSTRIKRPLRFLHAIRKISDQFPPCLHFAIGFSVRKMAADVAL